MYFGEVYFLFGRLFKTENMTFRIEQLLFFFLLCTGCTPEKPPVNKAQHYINLLKTEFAPDKRVAVFTINSKKEGERYVLRGETDQAKGLASLLDSLTSSSIPFVDSIVRLPLESLGKNTHAFITISVANLRSEPKHSAELATQATLGTPVNVLKKEGDWYYIQTPDNYLSWVDAGALFLCDETTVNNWQKAVKIIYTETYGHCYLGPDKEEVVSDLVAGNILSVVKHAAEFYMVRFPDGRNGYVDRNESELLDTWLENLDNSPSALVDTSKKLMGVPYLWGGTSTKGMDCSGFTKTIYFLNGMIIPRDASQQVHTGIPIDDTGSFKNLEPGDLLFFGRKASESIAEKVVHVGMWIGNNEFIHASDMVRVSSVDKDAPNYDEHNVNRYLRTKRILKQEDDGLIELQRTFSFKSTN